MKKSPERLLMDLHDLLDEYALAKKNLKVFLKKYHKDEKPNLSGDLHNCGKVILKEAFRRHAEIYIKKTKDFKL